MQITMEALEQALAPIEAVGKGEIDFKVNGITVTLRRLLPEEESEAQKFAVNRSDDESSNALEYIQRFKLAILSYALVAIGSLNLRDVQYVETGETLEIEGTGGTPKKIVPVKILRHVAMRQMLIKWAAPARIAMFQQYAELLNRVEDLAEEMVELAPSNLGVEIERLEQRLAKLRERQSSEKESLESDVSKLVKTIHQWPIPCLVSPRSLRPQGQRFKPHPLPNHARTRILRTTLLAWKPLTPLWTWGIQVQWKTPSMQRTCGCSIVGKLWLAGKTSQIPRQSCQPHTVCVAHRTWPPVGSRVNSMVGNWRTSCFTQGGRSMGLTPIG
jgi:hypothetical protein